MKKSVIKLLSVFFITGTVTSCSSRHNIAGTDYGWSEPGIQILSDIEVSGLQARHARRLNSNCIAGYYDHIELDGPIGPDSTYVLEQLLERVEKCTDKNTGTTYPTLVYMHSNGGLVKDGYSMGRILRKYQAATAVTGGRFCASACAIAFLGGIYREIFHDGRLLFHSPYLRNEYDQIVCSSRKNSLELRDYFQEMLTKEDGQRVFDRTMDYCDTSNGWTVNSDAADIFKITR